MIQVNILILSNNPSLCNQWIAELRRLSPGHNINAGIHSSMEDVTTVSDHIDFVVVDKSQSEADAILRKIRETYTGIVIFASEHRSNRNDFLAMGYNKVIHRLAMPYTMLEALRERDSNGVEELVIGIFSPLSPNEIFSFARYGAAIATVVLVATALALSVHLYTTQDFYTSALLVLIILTGWTYRLNNNYMKRHPQKTPMPEDQKGHAEESAIV